MDKHKSHWETTLFGYAFWRDAEDWNKAMNDSIEAETKFIESKPTASKTTEIKKPLHECFPFTIGPEQPSHSHPQPQPVAPTPTMTDPKTTTKFSPHSCRFSMGEALTLGRFHSTGSSPLTRSCRARSSLCSDSSGQTPTITEHSDPSHKRTRSSSRSRSLLRLPLTLIRSLSNSRKREAQLQLIPNDQATTAKPLEEFRGGQTWSRLSTDRENLGLDLFWPIPLPHASNNPHSHSHSHSHPLKEETNGMGGEGEDDLLSLPIAELAPLTHFRNLRSLKLVGMMNTYQPTIWQTAWLNPHLEDLELGMALPPSLRKPYVSQWPVIRGGWKLSMGKYEEPVYYGNGTGTLAPHIGLGAYLDKICIEKAKVKAMSVGRTRTRLSIKTLVLSGFVVDADAIMQWFDAVQLERVRFRGDCVDAGFSLGEGMGGVSVVFEREEGVEVGRWIEKGEIRVVSVRGAC